MRWLAVAFVVVLACEPGRAGSAREVPPASGPPRRASADAPPPPADPAPGATEVPEAAPKPAPRPGAYANVDPNDDDVVGPPDLIDDCEGKLARAGVTFRPAKIAVRTQKKSKIVCGAPQVVLYREGPGKIAYSPPPTLTCGLALALASFEKLAQEEATKLFGSRIVRIKQLGTYNCREMARFPGWVSEHSYANAIDVAAFSLANGLTITIQRDFDASVVDDPPPKGPKGLFLRRVSRRAHDEDVFSHVLTPFWDALHKNHFHLDLARYRSDGTRPHD